MFSKFCLCLNLTKHLARHIGGPNHTDKHHKISGAIVMATGVGLVKLASLSDLFLLHYFAEMVGFAIHAIGVVPFISTIENVNHNSNLN